MRKSFTLLPLALSAVLSGCSDPTGPTSPILQFHSQVVFGIRAGYPTEVEPVERRTLSLTGILTSPHSAFAVGAVLTTPGPRGLLVTVIADQVGIGYAYPTLNYYTGVIAGLAKGEYTVQVLHVIRGETVDTTTAFDGLLTVR